MNVKKIIQIFQNAKGYVSMTYTNKQGEKSKVLIYVGFHYENLVKKDIETIENFLLLTNLGYVPSENYSRAEWNEALTELLDSLKAPDPNRSAGQRNAYCDITQNGAVKLGMKDGLITNKMYIRAELMKKDVLVEGTYKEVKSSGKTIAKNVIKKNYLSTGKIKTYVINAIEDKIKSNGEIVEIDE